jgi:HEAT repeat protein
LSLDGTLVTRRGIEPLIRQASRRPIWPSLWTDVSFDEQQLPLLTKVLRHPDPRGREWAVHKLAKMDPVAAATPLLIEALEDPDSSWNSRNVAVRTLARIGSASTTSKELSRTVERALELPLLISVFGIGDTQAQTWAVGRVVEMDPLTAVPALIKDLDTPHGGHYLTMEALRRIGSAPTISQELFQAIERAMEKRLLVARGDVNKAPHVLARRMAQRKLEPIRMKLSKMREARANFLESSSESVTPAR